MEALKALECVAIEEKVEAVCSVILALFNSRRFVSKFKDKIASRKQAKKFQLKKAFAVERQLSPLLGRNAFSLLEIHF